MLFRSHPIVMETFLRYHAPLARVEDAFTNGVISSMMMRYDTSPEDSYISPYIHYEPSDPEVAAAWYSLVANPCETALRKTYGELSRSNSLEQLFHYRPMAG